MSPNSFKLFLLFFSFTLVLACATDDAKSNSKIEEASRLTVPVSNSQVQIGTQIWMTKNLNVSRYRNGDLIPQVTNANQWRALTTGAWCYYENNTTNGPVYGKLYNWYAVNDPRGLAPQGWHVPSITEWITLATFLGGDSMAGGKMKATVLWSSPNAGATNSSGFTGLPGGYFTGTSFGYMGDFGFWWASTAYNTQSAYNYLLNYGFADSAATNNGKYFGCSVRCLKD